MFPTKKQWSLSTLHPPILPSGSAEQNQLSAATTPPPPAITTASPSSLSPVKKQTYVQKEPRFTTMMMRRNVAGISPHALDRLGVKPEILKQEKGMKKLGICEMDLAREEELRRYSGLPRAKSAPSSKPESIFGFTEAQLLRAKAIKRLGTSEQEIFDEYCRRVSMLGAPVM